MLPTKARLRRGSDVVAVIRRGKRGHASPLTVHVRLQPPPGSPAMIEGASPPARVAFVVPKAVGGAVQRNLVKRRLRHVVGSALAELPAGADIVVRVAPPGATTSAAALGVAFRRALGKVKTR